jgi:predicted Zn-dependent protease
MISVLAIVGQGACGGGRFLGAEVPAACAHDPVGCQGWTSDYVFRTIGLHDAHAEDLRAYAQGVADRLVRAGHLTTRPRVAIVIGQGSAGEADAGEGLSLDSRRLAVLDSEAELAAVIGHELIHLQAGHGRASLKGELPTRAEVEAWRRDLEQLADVRAVALLRAAGYDPHGVSGMLRALHRSHVGLDPLHPTLAARLAAVELAIATQPGAATGEVGRAAFHAHLAGLALDDRLFADVVGKLEVLTLADLAFANHVDGASRVTAQLKARALGEVWIGKLVERRVERHGGREVIRGRWAAAQELPEVLPGTTAAYLAASATSGDDPWPGDDAAVVLSGDYAVMFSRAGTSLDPLLATLRAPTAAERAAVVPGRLRFLPARQAGPFAAVARATCPRPDDGLDLDEPTRVVAVGELIKCVAP